jgi:putative glutamine amidotransferase
MKKIIVTQRVDLDSDYNERRDAIDQRWVDFLLSIDIFPIFISNNMSYVAYALDNEDIDGVLFTGGNSLLKYGGDSPERDRVETFILKWAIEMNIPVLGVCRGMQFIQDFFGVPLKKINNHVSVCHTLRVEKGLRLSTDIELIPNANSYHNYGTDKSNGELLAVAHSLDGIVMALEHRNKSIFGIMWHCERNYPLREEDKNLVRSVFC